MKTSFSLFTAAFVLSLLSTTITTMTANDFSGTECLAEIQALEICESALSPSVLETCNTCFESFTNDDSSLSELPSCDDATNFLCSLDCQGRCGGCADEFEAYFECVFEAFLPACEIFCGGDDGSPTTEDSSPTIEDSSPTIEDSSLTTEDSSFTECLAEFEAVLICQSALSPSVLDTCNTCFNTFTNDMSSDGSQSELPSCSEAADFVCDFCEGHCGGCADEFQAMLECAVEEVLPECDIVCDGSPSAEDIDGCLDEIQALDICESALSESELETCDVCVDSFVDDIWSDSSQSELPSCDDATNFLCSLDCQGHCGGCDDELEAYFECIFEALLPDCDIPCSEDLIGGAGGGSAAVAHGPGVHAVMVGAGILVGVGGMVM